MLACLNKPDTAPVAQWTTVLPPLRRCELEPTKKFYIWLPPPRLRPQSAGVIWMARRSSLSARNTCGFGGPNDGYRETKPASPGQKPSVGGLKRPPVSCRWRREEGGNILFAARCGTLSVLLTSSRPAGPIRLYLGHRTERRFAPHVGFMAQ